MRKLQYFLVLVILLSMVGCAVDQRPVHMKDGKPYGVTSGWTFRGKWWDYYERGVSYAAGGFWSDAAVDLQEALRRTPTGRDRDRRDARTYGFHFLGYFPHLELGAVYYHLERYPEAIAELESSLRSVDTARAKFYLNAARRALLQQTGRDTQAPSLTLDTPQDGLWTNRLSLEVRGRAEDDAYVHTVEINGQKLFIELAEPQLSFTWQVLLREGPNAITVVARDLLGRATSEQRTVYVKRQGPLLELQSVDVVELPSRRARITGWITDDSPVRRFVLAGSEVQPGADGEFQVEIALTGEKAGLPFEVEDAAGNVTRGEVALSPAAGAPQDIREGQFWPPERPRWAVLSPGDVVSDLPTVALTLPWSRSRADRDPPVIHVPRLAEPQTVYDDTVYVEGRVTDASPLTAFTVNGTSLWRRKSRQLFFGTLLPLQEGDNRIRLEAVDEAGNTQQCELVITRKIPEARRLQERLALGIPRFSRWGEESEPGKNAYSRLLNAFVRQARFRLVEQERLEALLSEQSVSHTTLVDPQTAVKLGKLVRAEGILVGVLITKSPHTLEVFAEFVDVDTGIIMAVADVYGENLTWHDTENLMNGLEWKLRQHFPLVEGSVTSIEGKRVFVDLCSQRPLKEPMKILLFRDTEEARDAVTGKARLRRTDKVGEARIKQVHNDTCETILEQLIAGTTVQHFDKAITK